MVPLIELAVATAAFAISAGLITLCLRLRGIPACLLACYVIGYSEIIGVTAALSVARAVGRWEVTLAAGALLAVAIIIWVIAGRPRMRSGVGSVRKLVAVLRDWPLAVLALGLALALLYVGAVALFTPPNSADALWYHLARAAFWKQQHAVGYIPHVNDERLNAFPPVGEIAVLYTMVVAGIDRFVTMPELAAYLAMTLAVFGIPRRLAVARREALFAALVFATLPVVVLQASGALNDLVIGSFLVICVFFLLGDSNAEAVLAGLALTLAFATKAYAPLALPLIAAIAVFVTPRSRARKFAAIGVLAVIGGSSWNFLNLVETGSYEGRVQNETDYSLHGAVDVVALPARYVIDFAEVPGVRGWWLSAYVVSALAVAGWFLWKRPAYSRLSLLAAFIVGCTPFLVIAIAPIVNRAYRAVLFHVDRPDLGILGHDRSVFTSGPEISYFGPLGLVLLLSPLVLLAARRQVEQPVFFALAAAPLLTVLGLTVTIGYGGLNGRFFAFAIALAVVPSALFLIDELTRWAVVAVALPTLGLSLYANLEKPPSVWGEPRWKVQTLVDVPQARVVKFAQTSIPAHAHIGLTISEKQWSYPFFGPQFEHVVSFVPTAKSVPAEVGWLTIETGKPTPPAPFRAVGTFGGFHVYKRERER